MRIFAEPKIGINDVLVRVRYTGICGTDVHIYDWDEWAQNTIPVPMAIGHEFVGEIVAVGSNVNDFFIPATSSAAKATSFAAAAETASQAGVIFAPQQKASASIAPEHSLN